MTIRYVRSGAAGSNNGTSWANAFTTMTTALAAGAAGDTYYVSEDHAESTAGAVTLVFNGTQSTPDNVICVNHAGSVPPVSADLRTTGQITTTGTNSITLGNGYAYIYGVKFNNSTGSSSATMFIGAGLSLPTGIRLENCQLNLLNTATGGRVSIGATNAAGVELIELINTTVSFGNVSQAVLIGSGVVIRGNANTFVQGATIPTSLFAQSGAAPVVLLEGLDLSNVPSGHNLVNGNANSGGRFVFANCKLAASVTISSVSPLSTACFVDLVNCDSAATGYRQERYTAAGTLSTETTNTRIGGANDSVQTISWKCITTANTSRANPLDLFAIDIWNAKTGQTVNVNLEVLNDGVTLQNTDIYAEAYYLGDSGDPGASRISSQPADPLAAGTNLTSSSATWTTTGLTTPIAQKITLSFTPLLAGYVRVYVRILRPSKTIWVDPAAYFS